MAKSAVVVCVFDTGEFILQREENGEGLSEAENCEADDVENDLYVIRVALEEGEDRQKFRKCMGEKHNDLKANH